MSPVLNLDILCIHRTSWGAQEAACSEGGWLVLCYSMRDVVDWDDVEAQELGGGASGGTTQLMAVHHWQWQTLNTFCHRKTEVSTKETVSRDARWELCCIRAIFSASTWL
jgi:hypothetical protein